MLDIRLIRENPEAVREAARRKRIAVDVDRFLDLDRRFRELTAERDTIRAEQRKSGKEIATLSGPEKERRVSEMGELARRLKESEAELAETERLRDELLAQMPNIPAPEVPEGRDDTENVEVRRWGEIPRFEFDWKDHVELGERQGWIDFARASRIAGSRTYFLKGDAALLELAVLRFALDRIMAKGFTPFIVPDLVKREALFGTGYFPGGEEQAYACERDGLHLAGTAEVPVTSYHMGEILAEADLPLRYAGFSTCFRREAGTYGKDTKGLYRIHQFQKVEQVVIGRDDVEESKRFHEEILRNAEEIVQALELPYRVVNVCDGDLGLGQVQKFDIEVWMPSRNAFGETHSASRFHEFQARRLSLRYRDAQGKLHFCHTLNNTVVASPRILIPLLENHQKPDGTVRIPEALVPYMGGRRSIG